MVASSCFSFAMRARSLSRWLLTDTYSPSAIEMAPPTRPATPAVRMGATELVAPATPTTMAATETIPSLAPSTPARSQLRRLAKPPPWGSFEWVTVLLVGFQRAYRAARDGDVVGPSEVCDSGRTFP